MGCPAGPQRDPAAILHPRGATPQQDRQLAPDTRHRRLRDIKQPGWAGVPGTPKGSPYPWQGLNHVVASLRSFGATSNLCTPLPGNGALISTPVSDRSQPQTAPGASRGLPERSVPAGGGFSLSSPPCHISTSWPHSSPPRGLGIPPAAFGVKSQRGCKSCGRRGTAPFQPHKTSPIVPVPCPLWSPCAHGALAKNPPPPHFCLISHPANLAPGPIRHHLPPSKPLLPKPP